MAEELFVRLLIFSEFRPQNLETPHVARLIVRTSVEIVEVDELAIYRATLRLRVAELP